MSLETIHEIAARLNYVRDLPTVPPDLEKFIRSICALPHMFTAECIWFAAGTHMSGRAQSKAACQESCARSIDSAEAF